MTRIFSTLFFFFSFPIMAAEEPPFFATDGAQPKDFDYWSEFVNMLVTLGILVVLIFASVWALKKIMRSRAQNLNSSKGIKIIEQRVLNQKASLYVVEVLGKGLVIAESQAGIHLISEFPEGTDLTTLVEQERSEYRPKASLFQFAKKCFSRS